GVVGRAAEAGAIDPVHAVAILHEEVDPARTSPDTHHVRALAAAAMHHHDGIGMLLLRRDHVLDEELALRDLPVGHLLALHVEPEAALVGELHRERIAIAVGIDHG